MLSSPFSNLFPYNPSKNVFCNISVSFHFSTLQSPLRNYLKTTFLPLVHSHSAPIPMLSELLLGLKTAWLTSTICCLYFHPSPREEMYCKEFCFQGRLLLLLGWGFLWPRWKIILSKFWSKKGKFIQTHPEKLSQQCSLGGWQSTPQGTSRSNCSITLWVGNGLTSAGVSESEIKLQHPEFRVETRDTITYVPGVRYQAGKRLISEHF